MRFSRAARKPVSKPEWLHIWSDHVRATEVMFGFSSSGQYPLLWLERWAARSSLGLWSGGINWVWIPMTGCFRIKILCPKAASAI